MSTLHLYHWKGMEDLKQRIKLVDKQDNLVIIGSPNDQDLEELLKNMDWLTACNWQLVNSTDNPQITEHTINHDEWLELIINHQNSFAWK